MAKHRCSLVACARWETDAIREWLLYHASIGFDHVYLYCNDDDPREFYREVLPFLAGPAPFVSFLHYPFKGQQRRMYEHFIKTKFDDSDWVSFLDIDEFLYLPRDCDVNALTGRVEADTDVLHLNWLNFGTNGFAERPPGSLLEQYVRHEAVIHPLTKCLIKTSAVHPAADLQEPNTFWHSWPDARGVLRRRDVLGRDMDGYYDDFPQRALPRVRGPGMLERLRNEAIVCHFVVKSEADLQRRLQRGTDGDFAGQKIWARPQDPDSLARQREEGNALELLGLRNLWRTLTELEKVPSAVPCPFGVNVAHGKAATQSSISEWSRHDDVNLDAAGAVSGTVRGEYQFHTGEEDAPWWHVDLGERMLIRQVRVYNTLDHTSFRSRHLTIAVSHDGLEWYQLYRRTEEEPFGGIDGFPLIWTPVMPVASRFLRVGIPERGFLHLDQIEVYA